jgi:hypothetical protein
MESAANSLRAARSENNKGNAGMEIGFGLFSTLQRRHFAQFISFKLIMRKVAKKSKCPNKES